VAVHRTLEAPGRAVNGLLTVGFQEVPLDFAPIPAAETLALDLQSEDAPRRRKAAYLLTALKEGRPLPTSYPCPVQVMRFGNELLLIALGGEPAVEYALRFKAEFAGSLVWVTGYANDMFGYVPTRRMQQEGGYEGGRAMLWSALPGPFTETVEERVTGAVHRLVDEATM
jgi:neutral ceramidase